MATSKRERKYALKFTEPSHTQTHFKDSCNVNRIVSHYRQHQVWPENVRREPQFGYATSRTFEEAARQVAEIRSAFAELPSAERALHQNDPALWLDHLASVTDTVTLDDAKTPPAATPGLSEPPLVPPNPNEGGE